MYIEYHLGLPDTYLGDPTLYPYACMHEDIQLYLAQLDIIDDIDLKTEYEIVYSLQEGYLYVYLDNGDCVAVKFK